MTGALMCISIIFARHCSALCHAEHLVLRNFSHGCPFHAPVEHVQSSSPQKSGAQGLSLSRAEHASQQAISGSLCVSRALVFACFALCHVSFVFPRRGGGGYGMVWYGMPYGIGSGWRAAPSPPPVFRAGVRGQLAVTLGCCTPGSGGGGGCCCALPIDLAGGGGGVTLGISPRGCEGTAVCRYLPFKRGGSG